MDSKKSLIVCTAFALLFGLASTACAQQDEGAQAEAAEATSEEGATEMSDTREKASYAIGLNMGRNFSGQGVDVDMDALIEGLRSGMDEDADAKYTDEELQAAMQAFQQEMMAAQQARMEREGTENAAAGEAFLSENAEKEGVTVLESGLQYEVLEDGGQGESPTAEDSVRVHYEGKLIDGTVFDSSYERGQPVVFPLGRVVAGFREGITQMQVGDKYRLYIPSELGYGERGAGANIPPNATLIFDIELLDINPGDAAAPPTPQGGQGGN
jgi:FKBP-type peptidyl-prolyl cis-trans isomerase